MSIVPAPTPVQATTPFDAPGLYLWIHDAGGIQIGEQLGPFRVHAAGRLVSQAEAGGWKLFLDGILTGRSNETDSDSALALRTFLAGGLEALSRLRGYYNVLLINVEESRALAVSDLLCSRPWYHYRRGRQVAVAPSPTAFAYLNLPMTLSRQALYEHIRLMHTGYDRTLVNEVRRALPGRAYVIRADALQDETRILHRFVHEPDNSLDLDRCAAWIKEICATEISGVLNHPALRGLPIQHALTAGLDSRHLLGELIEQESPPTQLRHVRIVEADYTPVRQIADALRIPLVAPAMDEMDTDQLLRRWAWRCGGLVNVHQFYLLQLPAASPAIAFGGYLMDWLLGIAPRDEPGTDPAYLPLLGRFYTGDPMLALLVPGARRWAAETAKCFKDEIEEYVGPGWFKLLMMDVHHRGLHYTGTLDTMVSDDLLSFSPGASAEAIRFASTAPRHVAGDRRGRLRALQRYFPELAAFPGRTGVPYSEMQFRIRQPGSRLANARRYAQALATAFRIDPAPESVHYRLRHHTDLNRMHRTVTRESALARDGYLRDAGLKTSWALLISGGYQGWTLMSVLTAEVAYRVLVLRESPEAVVGWLLSDHRGPAKHRS